MRRVRAAIAACLTSVVTLALCGSATAAVTAPYSGPRIASADNGETAVVWQEGGAVRAAIGTPGEGYGAPVTITAGGSATALVMDAAGDAVVVWEAFTTSNDCYKGSCSTDSLGVFASIRPAGGSFGQAVRLSPVQRYVVAQPHVVMNRAGDWVVALKLGAKLVVGAGVGSTPPSSFAAVPAPDFQGTGDLAIDETGTATFGVRDAANHPAVVTRTRDGSFSELAVLDNASSIDDYGLTIGVGPQGDALAVWPGGGFLRWSARPPGGAFAAAASSGVASVLAPESIGVDGRGRTTIALYPRATFLARLQFEVRRGTVSAPFGEPEVLTGAGRDGGGSTRAAIGSGGNAVLGWLDTERSGNAFASAAIAVDGGPFSKPFMLARGTSVAPVDVPAVAVDGAGRASLAWTNVSGNVQQVLAATVSPTAEAFAGPTLVEQGRLVVLPDPPPRQSRASASPRQMLRIRADGTVRPRLRCISSTASSCYGALRIDVRPAPGRKPIRLGTHRFIFQAGRVQPVVVRTTRAARRAAARRSLRGTITVTTLVKGGSALTSKTSVTVRRRSA